MAGGAFLAMVSPSQKVKNSFQRSFAHYHEAAIVQSEIAKTLAQALQKYETKIPRLLEFGAATGHLTETMLKYFYIETYFANDLVTHSENYLKPLFEKTKIEYQFLEGDVQQCSLPKNLNAIISSSTLQWIKNPKSLFKRFHNILEKDGLLVFSTFAPNHFQELRGFNSKSAALTYLDKDTLYLMLGQDFHVLDFRQEEKVLEFETPRKVLHHLRKTGVNANAGHHWTKGNLLAFEEAYRARFSVKGKIPLTYAPVYIIAQKY